MSNKSAFDSAAHLENMGSWKAGSATSNPRMLKSQSCQSRQLLYIGFHWFAAVTCHNWEHNQYPVTQTSDTITVLYVTNLGNHNSVTKPFASLHETRFSAAATKGWAWYKHNAELVEHTAALRSLKLLVGSGCLEFQNGMAGMDPETNMSSHGANICSWNAHSPVSNPRRLKALSAVVTEEHNQYIVTHFLDTTTLWPNHLLLCMRPFFFSYNELYEFGNDAKIWSWWSVLRLSGGVDAWNSKKEWRDLIP